MIDVGCGPGYWRNLFEGMAYVGFDQSPGMLSYAAEITSPKVKPLDWIFGNGRDLTASVTSSTYDMVFTASVLQHNRNEPDKREIVEGIYKVLKPGGFFLCTENTYRADNCPKSVGNRDYTDGYTMTPSGWEKFMLPLGFKLLDYRPPGEYFYQKM